MKTLSGRNSRASRGDCGSKSRRVQNPKPSSPDIKRGAGAEPYGGGVRSKAGPSQGPVKVKSTTLVAGVSRVGDGPDSGGPSERSTALVNDLYFDVSGAGKTVDNLRVKTELRKLVREGLFKPEYTIDSIPCAVMAFACAFTCEKHIRNFYKQLVRCGLNAPNGDLPIGGMSLMGMRTALKLWEAWAGKQRKEGKHEFTGIDLHHVECRGGELVNFTEYRTTLRRGRVQVIIFLEDLTRTMAHFCAASGRKPRSDKRVFDAVNRRAGLNAIIEDAEAESNSNVAGPASAGGAGGLVIVSDNTVPTAQGVGNTSVVAGSVVSGPGTEDNSTPPGSLFSGLGTVDGDSSSTEGFQTVISRFPRNVIRGDALAMRAMANVIKVESWKIQVSIQTQVVEAQGMDFLPDFSSGERQDENDAVTLDGDALALEVFGEGIVPKDKSRRRALSDLGEVESVAGSATSSNAEYWHCEVFGIGLVPKIKPSPIEPSQGVNWGTEFADTPVDGATIRYLKSTVEFIKTHSTTPLLHGQYVRAYACGGLVSEGCVEHADARYENGVGLTELHPEVLAKFNFNKKSFFYTTRGVEANPLDGKFLTNGQYNPGWISSVQIGNMSYKLEFQGFHGPCDYFCLRKAGHLLPKRGIFSCPMFLRKAWDGTCAWAADIGFSSQEIVKVNHATNMQGRLLPERSLAGFAGATRARWAVVGAHAREDIKGPYHSLYVQNADDPELDPKCALAALQSEKGRLEASHGKRGYCTVRLTGGKDCVSCGKKAPATPYKWKHRECKECQLKLSQCGAVSTMGRQIQLNMTVAEGHPGRVHLESSTLPPKKEKWDKVLIPDGAIKVHVSDVPWLKTGKKGRVPEAGRKLHSIVKEDLAKIDTGLERTKRECVLAGIGISGCYPMVTRKGFYSRMQALIGRAFLEKPTSSPAAWKIMDLFKHELLPADALDGERMSIDFWLTTMPARRRRALERAYKEYRNDGGLSEKDLTFSAFVKQELLAGYKKFDWGDAKPLVESIARMIMAPKDKAHIVAGPVIKPKLERLKRHWGPDNWLFYGATTPEKLQGWLDQSVKGCEDGEVFAFWCDYSMFDCTHSAESMRLIEGFYSEMQTDPEFARLINAWRAPKGRMGEMSYRAAIMLASGRDDTSLMNALLNGLVMGLSVAAAVAGVELEDLQKEHLRYAEAYIRISICGDDTLGFLPKHLWADRVRIMSEIQRNIARFGLVTKLDCTSYLGSAVYLGMRPYNVPTPTGRRWLWGRTVGRAAFKLGWMLDLAKGDAAAWATGVADSIVRTQPYVPILSDLARQTLNLRQGCKRTPVAVDMNKPWTNWTAQSDTQDLTYDRETLQCLSRSYATPTLYGGDGPISAPSADEFLQTVRAIERVPCLPYVIDDVALRFMCVTDDC